MDHVDSAPNYSNPEALFATPSADLASRILVLPALPILDLGEPSPNVGLARVETDSRMVRGAISRVLDEGDLQADLLANDKVRTYR